VIVVAANPYRGATRPRERVQALAQALAATGTQVQVVWDAPHRARLLGDAAMLAGVSCVVAAGGDGTVATVINELAGDVPLAVPPLGNETSFARAIGTPADPLALARAIAAGRTRPLDLGRATTSECTRRFGLMVSVGFDADVVHRIARARGAGTPRRVSRLSYLPCVAGALARYRHSPVAITVGRAKMRGALCVVSNLPQYAMTLSLTPAARGDDGLLDWLAFERPGLSALAGYAWAVARGRHQSLSHVRHGRARKVTLTSEIPVPVQLDGDPCGFTPVEVEVLPRALRVVTV